MLRLAIFVAQETKACRQGSSRVYNERNGCFVTGPFTFDSLCREFVERAGNFMPSLALLFILTGGQTAPWWFTRAASVATIATHGADSFVAHLVAMAVVFVIGVVYCVVLRLACGATKPHSA